MSGAFLLPVIAAALGGVLVGVIRFPFRPMLVVRALTALAVAITASVVTVLTLGTAAFASRAPGLAAVLASCPVIPTHHEIGFVPGLVSSILLATGLARAALVWRRWRRAGAGHDGRRFRIIEDCDPVAYAVPGNPGCVVVSSGLLDRLEPRERQVVFAHERAHLRLQHHRYLLASEIAAALVPPLHWMGLQLRAATERSADEAAVVALGGDRRVVASAIARAALGGGAQPSLMPALSGGSISVRIHALVGPASRPVADVCAASAVAVAGVAAVAAGVVQIHHVVEYIGGLCGL